MSGLRLKSEFAGEFVDMRRELEALVEELNRLKREGVLRLSVSEESIGLLRDALNVPGPSASARQPSKPVSGKAEVRFPDNHIHSSEASETFIRILDDKRKSEPTVVSEKPEAAGTTPDSMSAGSSIPPPPVVDLPAGDAASRWAALRNRVLNCPVCNAHVAPGKKVVFGIGSLEADIFFCGEAPGAEEETRGEPFIGPAGQLLTKIIKAMGLSREEVYIGNIMNWRPEHKGGYGNRPPHRQEMDFCLPYLKAQIEVVNPKVVVALGATAVRGLLGSEQFSSMGKMRGQWRKLESRPLMITYHPSFLLREQPKQFKRLVWEDMLQVMERIPLPVSERQRGYFL